MTVTRFSKARAIPSITTKKTNPVTTNFSKGILTYKPNDTMDYNEVYLAQNARFERIGEYTTRRGLSAMNSPIGLTQHAETISGSDTLDAGKELSNTIAITGGDITLYKIAINARTNDESEYCPTIVEIYENDNFISRATLPNKSLTGTTAWKDIIFEDAPILENNKTYTIKLKAHKKNIVEVIGQESTDSVNFRLYKATAGKITSIFESDIDGTKTILFTFKTSAGTTTMYRMDSAGNITSVRQLPSGVENVRYAQNINQIRYADGVESPRLVNPASSWADSAIVTKDLKTDTDLEIKVSNIMDDTEDNIIYFDADTNTQAVWTYPYGFMYNNTAINSYDKFDRDFRQNFPAIKTGDPITAMFNLGGVIYIMTRRNKYLKYSQTADVWTQSASNAQNGTFSQESVVCDLNYAYFANDNGVYIFDGSSESSLTQNAIQNTYDSIKGKESIRIELFNNRLYVFYSSNGNGVNDSCLVYNTNLKLWESFDTKTYVNATLGRKSVSNRFICGHSRIGLLMTYENGTNEYADLNSDIEFDIETSYLHFGAPSQAKRITKWRPEFALVDGDYMVKCGYALDYTDIVKYAFSVNLKDGNIYNEHTGWDSPSDYGVDVTPTKISTTTMVYGAFRRCQLRYQHHAAFEPVSFKSHTLSTQIERIV